MDFEAEQKIWRRVEGNAEGNAEGLRGMELRCRESAAMFRRLAQDASGEAREQLTALHRKEHKNAAAIRGLRILNGEEPEPLQGYAPAAVSRRRALAQAYRRSLQAKQDYEASVQWSPVFRKLAEAECETQQIILALIGIYS